VYISPLGKQDKHVRVLCEQWEHCKASLTLTISSLAPDEA